MTEEPEGRIVLPNDKELASQMLALDYKLRTKDRGLMGYIFGASTEKSGNIAGFAIIVFSLMFAAVLFWGQDTTSLSKKDELLIVGGFVSLALGFLFGRTTS